MKRAGEVEVVLSREDVSRILSMRIGFISNEGELALRLALRKAEHDDTLLPNR